MLLVNSDCCTDNCCGLHLSDFRIGYGKTASTVTHHRVELVKTSDDSLDLLNGLTLSFCKSLDLIFGVRNELMKRRIQETNGNRVTFHGLEELFEVVLLIRKDLSKCCFSLFYSIRADHLTECCNTLCIEEHMLGTAETDTFSTKLTSLLSVCRSIRIGTNLHGSELVSPSHDTAELTGDLSIYSLDNAIIDVTGSTIDGDEVSFMEFLTGKGELLVLLIHVDVATTGYTALTHTTCNYCCMAGHTTTNGKNTFSGLHTGDIFRGGLKTNEDNLLALSCPCNCIISSEYDLTASCSRGSAKALSDRGSCLKSCSIELRMKKGVKVTRIDHSNCFFLGLVSFINKVASDLQSCLSSSLTVTALKHVELLVLNSELHILHVMVVILKSLTNLQEFSVSFREFLLHLSDGHRSTNTCNYVFTLCIDEELTHKLVLTGCRITGKCNTGTGLFIQVTEYHRHYVNSGTPGIRDVVVTTIYVCTRVIPGTEYSLDSELELLYGIRREISTKLVLVFSLELLSKFLKVSCGKIDVVLNTTLFLHLVDQLLEVLLTNFHNDIREHLDESSVRVVYETLELRIRVAGDHSCNYIIVKTKVQDGIHHTGHGCTSTGTNRNKKGILKITELLTVLLFHPLNTFHGLSHNLIIDLTAILIVLCTCFRSDCETLGNRKTDFSHLSKVCTFTTEKVSHGHVSFSEGIDPFCHLYFPPK